jgi:hypothetical protein
MAVHNWAARLRRVQVTRDDYCKHPYFWCLPTLDLLCTIVPHKTSSGDHSLQVPKPINLKRFSRVIKSQENGKRVAAKVTDLQTAVSLCRHKAQNLKGVESGCIISL